VRRAAATICSLLLAGVLLAGGTLAALPGESAAQKLTAGEQVWGTISRAVAMVRDAFRIVTGRDGERQPEISKPASSTKNTAKAASFVPHPKQAAPAAGGKSVDRKLGAGEGNVNARDKTARALEQAIFQELNRVRREHKLPEFRANEQIAEMARLKSIEILESGIVTHDSSKYGYAVDMYKKAGLPMAAGSEVAFETRRHIEDAENLASIVVEGWLDSPAHRRQILHPVFEEVGVGVAWVPKPVWLQRIDTGEQAEMRVSVNALLYTPLENPPEGPAYSDFPSIKDIIKGPGGG